MCVIALGGKRQNKSPDHFMVQKSPIFKKIKQICRTIL